MRDHIHHNQICYSDMQPLYRKNLQGGCVRWTFLSANQSTGFKICTIDWSIQTNISDFWISKTNIIGVFWMQKIKPVTILLWIFHAPKGCTTKSLSVFGGCFLRPRSTFIIGWSKFTLGPPAVTFHGGVLRSWCPEVWYRCKRSDFNEIVRA